MASLIAALTLVAGVTEAEDSTAPSLGEMAAYARNAYVECLNQAALHLEASGEAAGVVVDAAFTRRKDRRTDVRVVLIEYLGRNGTRDRDIPNCSAGDQRRIDAFYGQS
ncbi:hypothetical protein NI454_11195 [Brevundimonas diminuta]|uniref:hypothetical protein n=1 Tax=Brevundimonas diminuta TaxID=293 RepID=UPI002097C805|nr:MULTISPECIES: hypothetical protein [Brevundimonas]MCO8030514.1 hypothetical protein [Brevundimonas diminuta]